MKNILFALSLVFFAFPAFAADKGKESAYDRVMKTQTIRCGYGTYAPWIYQDLKTEKMAGPNVEIMEAVARQLGFKLEWPEETGWPNLPTALVTGRVDVACSSLWMDPARGKLVAYTRPVHYNPVYAYARADDARFSGKAESIDKPGIRIVVQDGDVTAELARRNFPQAQFVTLAQTASSSEMYMNVTTGKADIAFGEDVSVSTFNKAQKTKLKKIPLPRPVVIYGSSLAVGIHETALKEMLDTTVAYLLNTGKIDEIMTRFMKDYPEAVILIKKPYE